MKKLITPLNVLFVLLIASFSSAMAIDGTKAASKDQMVTEFERAKAYTQEYLDAMPADGFAFKPTPDIRSFAQQMLHIAGGNFGIGAAASGMTNPYAGKDLEKMPEMQSKEAVTKIVNESYDFLIAGLKSLTAEKLAETVTIFRWDMTREMGFMKVFEHQTHHRGQATIYLRLSGVKPPNEKLF